MDRGEIVRELLKRWIVIVLYLASSGSQWYLVGKHGFVCQRWEGPDMSTYACAVTAAGSQGGRLGHDMRAWDDPPVREIVSPAARWTRGEDTV